MFEGLVSIISKSQHSSYGIIYEFCGRRVQHSLQYIGFYKACSYVMLSVIIFLECNIGDVRERISLSIDHLDQGMFARPTSVAK